MELVRRINGATALQQIKWRGAGGARGVHHGLVFRGVFVGLEQNLVELLAHRLRANALAQLLRPLGDQGDCGLFLLDGHQRLGNHLGRGLTEKAFACAAKVVRRLKQADQHGRLLL